MGGLGSILNSARSAMQATQVAMQTTSQNIANAGVEGYTVQNVRVAAQVPLRTPYGNLGTGVVVQSVTQSRDALLDMQFRTATGAAANQSRTSDTLGRIEAVLGEPSTTGLANSIDAFWNSWSDLANDPTSLSARGVVRQRGSEVSGLLNNFARQLDGIDRDARTTLTSDVGRINELSKQIADLAPAIVGAEAGGQTANDLRDTRNRLLDQVATLIDTRVIDRPDGSVGVYLGGRMLVDGPSAHQLTINGGQPLSVSFAGEADGLRDIGGSIGASITDINQRIPAVMTDLDTLAGTLVRETNTVHAAGTVFTGSPAVASAAGNFFNQTALVTGAADPYQTARGISLSASLSNIANIAAAGAGAAGPGNNGVAAQLAALRDKAVTFSTAAGGTIDGTIGGFYRYTVSSVALSLSQSSGQVEAQDALASQADTRRQSVSGVSTDDELVNMIKQQQAYAAAAKLIKVVDEMAQTLLDLGR
ncbi:MAG: flagellar hook-associated protein FlgK [bacterium]